MQEETPVSIVIGRGYMQYGPKSPGIPSRNPSPTPTSRAWRGAQGTTAKREKSAVPSSSAAIPTTRPLTERTAGIRARYPDAVEMLQYHEPGESLYRRWDHQGIHPRAAANGRNQPHVLRQTGDWGGDMLFQNDRKLSISCNFDGIVDIRLRNKMGHGGQAWSTASLFLVSGVDKVFGAPDRVDASHLRDAGDATQQCSGSQGFRL